MSATPKPIEPDLEKSLLAKSNQDLMDILENPADWKPEVVDFARLELGRRSVSLTQIEQTLVEKARQRDEEFQKCADVPLTSWQSFFAVLDGLLFGLLGLVFIWPQASRFKRAGYILKSKKSWKLYWIGFAFRIGIVAIFIVILIAKP